MSKGKLTLYFDVLSPFAYLAFHYITTADVFRQVDLTLIPVSLSSIMSACGNTPPLRIKNKAEWINRERLRWARLYKVPMCEAVPDGFPMRLAEVNQALAVVQREHNDSLQRIAAELYRLFWVERQQIKESAISGPVFLEVLGHETGRKVLDMACLNNGFEAMPVLIIQAATQQGKQMLADNTADAIAQGAFGLPWMIATDVHGVVEKYWGFDHLGLVMNHLSLDRKDIRGML